VKGRGIVLRTKKDIKRLTNSVHEMAIRCASIAKRGRVLRVAIVSCDRWKGKVYDDLLLRGEFLKRDLDAKIVSWQDGSVKWGKFDAIVIGSMWGYQNFLSDFEKWLAKIEENGAVVVNPIPVIRKNYDKAEQFRILRRAGVPVVRTGVLKMGEIDSFELPEGKFVIKPTISGGGENTFLVQNRGDFEEKRSKLRRLNEERELLVQPFVPEISAGELGVVMIGGKIMNVVRRFPGVLEGKFKVEKVKTLAKEARNLADKIAEMPEFREASYLRIDMVERKTGPVIMEVEAFEPQLYYYLLKGKAREKALDLMVTEVVDRYDRKVARR